MLASEMERLEWHRDSKEKASRSLRAAGPFLPSLFYRTRPSPEEGWMSDSASALAEARKSSIHLAGWSGTRAPKRPSRQILDCIHALPGGHHDRVPAIGNALHGHCPAPVEHIDAPGDQSDGCKSQSKQCEGCQQFPHEVQL